MKRLPPLLLALGGAVLLALTSARAEPGKVDPFIGTDGTGKTFPGASVPYGMVQLSPDNGRTGWDWIAGYFYPDTIIAGFSHTHLTGTGAGDLYDISFMPAPDRGTALTKTAPPPHPSKKDDVISPPTAHSRFRHERETARPGYYAVYLEDYDIEVELTAGGRTGWQRYRFGPGDERGVVKLDLGYSRNWDQTLETHLKIIDERTIAGYRKSTGWARDQRIYFHTIFSKPVLRRIVTKDRQVSDAAFVFGRDIEAVFEFDTSATPELTVRTALSTVSMENARLNLEAEPVKASFDKSARQAEKLWREELGRIEISASPEIETQFYTALYHSALAPRRLSDANGQYKGPDGRIHRSLEGPRYDFFSLWDTFRALHPLKTITHPELTGALAQSLMAHYDAYGTLPVWSFQGGETDMMLGYHAVPVLYDAWKKGLTDIDGGRLLKAFLASAEQNRFGLSDYRRLGYVPVENGPWNASRTLEYAYDDAAIARLAEDIGREKTAAEFRARAQNYRNQFDPELKVMRGRREDGAFREPFDPLAYHPEDFSEANAVQYSWFAPHDIEGLIKAMGGADAAEASLDALFEAPQSEEALPEWISGFIGQYVHGNEPSHHVAYIYQYLGRPDKTQRWVRKIMQSLYTTAPDGLPGNEDAGQMSAWYVFSALGFYPVDPISGRYILGSPVIDSAKFRLPRGKTFRVIAHDQSRDNVFVSQVRLNGNPIERNFIKHDELVSGGLLEFFMSPVPNNTATN